MYVDVILAFSIKRIKSLFPKLTSGWQNVETNYWTNYLKDLVTQHFNETNSNLLAATITTTKTVNGKKTSTVKKVKGTISEIEDIAAKAGTITSVNVIKEQDKEE